MLLVGGNVPESERTELVKRFEGSSIPVALLSPTSLRDWGREKVIEGIFNVLNESAAKIPPKKEVVEETEGGSWKDPLSQ